MIVDEQLMAPELVLQEAREMRRYYDGEKKPYTAGVISDCIATIETLQTQLAARQAAAPQGREALEERQLFEAAHKAYFKATETSDPQHWMEAALLAQQHRNALTKLNALTPAVAPDAGRERLIEQCAQAAERYFENHEAANPNRRALEMNVGNAIRALAQAQEPGEDKR